MLQPIDIKSKHFKKSILGYKTNDVEDFKDAVYKEYEELYIKYEKMSSDFEKLSSSLQDSRLRMFELENKIAESEDSDNVASAKAKADKIIRDAEATAKDIIAKAKAEAQKSGGSVEAPKPETKVAAKTEPKVEPKASVKPEPKTDNKVDIKIPPIKNQEVKVEPVKEETASSRFFKKAAEEAPAKKPFADEDDDEIFVGEIEDARKPERMMIGDGEEEEDLDFEFL